MSAELNVQIKLNLLDGEVQNLSNKLKGVLGSAVGQAASQKPPTASQRAEQHPDVIAANVKKKIEQQISQMTTARNKVTQQVAMSAIRQQGLYAMGQKRQEAVVAMSSAKIETESTRNRLVAAKVETENIRKKIQETRLSKILNPEPKKEFGAVEAAKGMLRSLVLYRAISEAMSQLRNAIMAVVGAFEKAKKLYVGGALSGFGTRMQTQRTAVAQVLGISEQDILRFGDAYKKISSELKPSIDLISRNARALAETNIQFEILRVKLEAIASMVAAGVNPAIKDFMFIFDKFAEFITKKAESINKWASRAEQASSFITNPIFAMAKMGVRAWREKEEAKNPNKLDELKPQMRQLGASAWEKMGLVIGGGGATNYAKDTAHNTKRANNLLETISRHLAGQQRGDNVFQMSPQLP